MLGQVAKRGVAAGLVGGTLAHLVTCQAAAVPLRFFTADLVTLLLVYGGYTKQALSPSGEPAASQPDPRHARVILPYSMQLC